MLGGFLTGCAAQVPELTKTALPNGFVIVVNGVQTTVTPAAAISMLGITNGLPGPQGIQGLQGAPGQMGSPGAQGLQGVAGVNGLNGASFHLPSGYHNGDVLYINGDSVASTPAILQVSTVQKKGQTSGTVVSTDKARINGEWIGVYLNITAITSGSVSIQYQYTDSNGVQQTKIAGSLSAKSSQSWISLMDNTIASPIVTTVIFAPGTTATYDITYGLFDLGK